MAVAKQLEKTTAPQLDVAAVVQLVMATCSASDEALIRAALGDALVTSIPAVARIFGVKESTVRNTWRRDGCPGEAKRGPGQRCRFVLADIVVWLLKRGAAADEGRARARGHVRDEAVQTELDQIALEMGRLRLSAERTRHAMAAGDHISLTKARADIAGFLTDFRDAVLEIPRHVRPVLPARWADQVAVEIDRLLRNYLTRLAEHAYTSISNPNGDDHVDNDQHR